MKKTILLTLLTGFNLSSWAALPNDLKTQMDIQQRLGYKIVGYGQNFDINEWVKKQLRPQPFSIDMSYLQIENKDIRQFEKEFKQLEELKRQNKQSGDDREKLKEAILKAGLQMPEQMLEEDLKRRLIYASESPNQLQEKMNYFWFNHFNIFYQKGADRVFFADYDKTMRQYAMGNFKDILRASLMHPAMLVYLDNFHSTVEKSEKSGTKKGGVNENYARELLELHTMGVDSGYTQKDIQELARILTGFTILPPDDNKVQELSHIPGVVIKDGFLFNPRTHDMGDKVFLGHVIHGQGFNEINEVLDILVNNPKTAQFISRKLAIYFVSDNPSNQLVNKMSQKFLETQGNIPMTLSVMINSQEFLDSVHQKKKFKDPYTYIMTSMTMCGACDYKNMEGKPFLAMMNKLGQPFLGHQTPDGYSMKAGDWVSSTQMQERFDVAQNIGKIVMRQTTQPSLLQANYKVMTQELSENTMQVLEQKDNKDKLNFLFASPEWMSY